MYVFWEYLCSNLEKLGMIHSIDDGIRRILTYFIIGRGYNELEGKSSENMIYYKKDCFKGDRH
jgi:hypothetical protein